MENYEAKLQLLDKHLERLAIIDQLEKDIKEKHENIDEHLETMNLEYQQRRQTEITNELLDVVIGAEVLNSKKSVL